MTAAFFTAFAAVPGKKREVTKKVAQDRNIFVRPAAGKRSKWVYNFAKLCYTKKKFLTFG